MTADGYNLDFASKKPRIESASIKKVLEIKTKGPWTTKSNAKLMVLFALPFEMMAHYFEYDPEELENIPKDFNIKGFREYSVRGIQKNMAGGGEFHRIRKEFIFGLEGLLKWRFEDVHGNTKEMLMSPDNGVYLPPFIMHSYESLENSSGILCIANTLFNPEDKRTHDTYSREIFNRIQDEVIFSEQH